MPDQREIHQREKAAKLRQQKIKKGATTFILILLALMMVVSLAPGIFEGGGSRGGLEIASVKGQKYNYSGGTAFYYLLTTMQNNMSRQYGNNIDFDQLRQYSVLQSVNSLKSMALSHQLAKRVGLKPSKDWLRFTAQRLSSNIKLENVNQGMRDFMEMEYALSALSPQGGDLLSVVAPITIAELYSYFDLVNYSVKAEIIYLDISNYIKERVQTKELKEHYMQNPGYYAESARIESLAVLSKELSETIQAEVLKSGWDTTLKKYMGMKDNRISYVPEKTVNAEKGTAERFSAVLKSSSNNLVLSPVLEEKAYHVIHILGYSSYESLSSWTKDALRSDYMALNFERLRAAYQNDIQDSISRLESKVNSGSTLSTASRGTAFSYFRSFNISPINQLLRDENDNKVDLPLMQNSKWMDFLFTGQVDSVSKTFYDDAYVVKMKILKRGHNSKIDYQNIDQQVYQRYLYFKNGAVSKDWVDDLQADYNFILKEENIKQLY